LVIMDINLPEKMDGIESMSKILSANKDIPVIIITGVSDDFKQFISTRRQVPPPEGYLSKPVEPGDLLGKVNELLT
ncbi:MAG: response regulator, partial [Gemmatimonadota bacterium]